MMKLRYRRGDVCTQNIELLVTSLEYIESHITEELKTVEIAKQCFCSKSTLEKLFRCVNSISVQEYIKRRRMMLAAHTISSKPNISILSVALECGYASHEAFARAFKEVWNCNPSQFRDERYFELYPKLKRPLSEGEIYMKQRKSVDISELYDVFCDRKNCWFICCDIKQMIPINNISRKAGDLAIIETMRRMDEVAGIDDMIFRIGGDEFCILTNSKSDKYAKGIVGKLLDMNGNTFIFEEKKIPLSLYVTDLKLQEKHMKYNELFQELHMAIKESKIL